MKKKYVVGVDVGATGTKAIVVDLAGSNMGTSYRDYPFEHPRPEYVELSAKNLREQVVVGVYDKTFAAYTRAYEALDEAGVYSMLSDLYPKE